MKKGADHVWHIVACLKDMHGIDTDVFRSPVICDTFVDQLSDRQQTGNRMVDFTSDRTSCYGNYFFLNQISYSIIDRQPYIYIINTKKPSWKEL